MKLIIQIPCYNEAETLEVALNDLPKRIDGIDVIEYLIINDGSNDATVEVAKNWGVHYVVSFKQNRGLAKGFMAGLDACLRNGADIIVNTDADNQYNGADIEKIIRPILEEKADIVIGERPIDATEHFSYVKKKLQHFGSWVVKKASNSNIPDAPSGFRAFSREAAMRMNVGNAYTYTLETIIRAGIDRIPMASVPIRTNGELRPSRLFNSMLNYVKKSMVTIIRVYAIVNPLKFWSIVSIFPFMLSCIFGISFGLCLFWGKEIYALLLLILMCTFIVVSIIALFMGVLADSIFFTRKEIEDVQYHVRKIDYDK